MSDIKTCLYFLFAMMAMSLAASAQEMEAASTPRHRRGVPSLPVPKSLVKLHPDEHFDWLLDNIDKEAMYFGYLKTRYFVLPTIRPGMLPAIYPDPKIALILLEKRIAALPKDEAGVNPKWFYYMGALAWGKRVMNRTGLQDGGEEYKTIFEHSESLAKHPDLFRHLVNDLCTIGRRPFRAQHDAFIRELSTSTKAFLPEFLRINQMFEREPDLSKLYWGGIDPKGLREILMGLKESEALAFPTLYRLSLFLPACTVNKEMQLPQEARHYLELTINHEKFSDLSTDSQQRIQISLFNVLKELHEDEQAVALQKEMLKEGSGGRAPLIQLYQKQINDFEKQMAEAKESLGTAGDDTTAAARKAIENGLLQLEKQRAESTEKRDKFIEEALNDFSVRSDTAPIAKVLVGNSRLWESYDYLARFLISTTEQDIHRINAALMLGKEYVRFEALREKQRTDKRPLPSLIPPVPSPSDGMQKATVTEKPNPSEAMIPFAISPTTTSDADNYAHKAMAVFNLIDTAQYTDQKDMTYKAALYALNVSKKELQQKLQSAAVPESAPAK